MFKKNPTSVRLTLRALGYLLSYPMRSCAA